MSLDAGGLAQMTYNGFNNGLGMPGAGFASRGKGAQLKRLSLASPPKVASISEIQESVTTPRTSRSHLLAGLRTAPKTPTGTVPASAPYNQTQHRFGLEASRYADQNRSYGNAMPQTATGASFSNGAYGQYGMTAQQQQMYAMPEQVLAPPPMQYTQDEAMDPNVLAQLMATELFLEERRKQLQRQLLSLTNTGLSLNDGGMGQQYPATPQSPSMNFYNQQQQFVNGVSGQQEINNGQYVAYNPLTGQYQYVDPHLQTRLANSPPPPTPSFTNSPPKADTPTFRAEVTPPDEKVNPFSRTASPPKKSNSPPVEVTPLPPPSANAFRRGHKKISSLSLNQTGEVAEGPRSAFVRPVGFPQTPSTGTFGPGQGRAGEHPIRQPRGPPSIEELKAAPTTKHEGSKNFATRQRRHAVKNLVRAGIERRGVRTGSAGSMSPVSETDASYDSDGARSGESLSSKPSIGSLRAAANGAIGSERKGLARNRSSVDNFCSANSVSSDEGVNVGGKLVEVKVEESKSSGERRNMPQLVLTSAEKRKSTMF